MVNQRVETIYESYLEELQKAVSNEARRFGGLTRILTGKRSGTEIIVDAFDAALEAELKRLSEIEQDGAELRELAEWMLRQSVNFRDVPQAKYTFLAALRHITSFTHCLSREDAQYLAEKLEAELPSRERFPVHKELIEKLRERAQAKEHEQIK